MAPKKKKSLSNAATSQQIVLRKGGEVDQSERKTEVYTSDFSDYADEIEDEDEDPDTLAQLRGTHTPTYSLRKPGIRLALSTTGICSNATSYKGDKEYLQL